MVRAWYMDDGDYDQREPHMLDNSCLSLEELNKKTGVEYFEFDMSNSGSIENFTKLKSDRGYSYEDVCEISRETLPNYDEKLKIFFTEHIHSDEEIRYIEAGSGYFDVRDVDDRWIRVEVETNDMLIVPAGIYHRFTLDTKNYIKARRFFVGEPVWTPINRPLADEHASRKAYLQMISAAG